MMPATPPARPGCWAAVLLLLGGCRAPEPRPADPGLEAPATVPGFLPVAEAAPFVGHPGVVFVDARPEGVWRKGHIPGAVQLSWTELRDPSGGTLTGRLDADLDRLAGIVGGRGVGSDHWVIVVGDPLSLWGEEGRIAWVLTYLGHERVSVLDGGMTAWAAAGHAVHRGRYERPPQPYEHRLDDSVLARKAEVIDASKAYADWRLVLVDVREPEEFFGDPGAPRYGARTAGRVPGSVNVPWKSLLDERGRLRSRDQLAEQLLPAGLRPDARILTYCTGGVRSAHTWWVLHSLGYPDVRNYAGSWWEYSLDRSLLIDTGVPDPLPYDPLGGGRRNHEAPGSDDDDSAGGAGQSGAEPAEAVPAADPTPESPAADSEGMGAAGDEQPAPAADGAAPAVDRRSTSIEALEAMLAGRAPPPVPHPEASPDPVAPAESVAPAEPAEAEPDEPETPAEPAVERTERMNLSVDELRKRLESSD